nr:aldolase/citrate lyase family protein [Arthrobacter sp. FW306-05-C]
MHDNPVKEALRSGATTTGTWLTLGSPAVAEALAHCGFDWLVVDLERAPNNPASAVEQLRAIDAARVRGARAGAIVRLAENDPVLAKRAMDIGAQTLIFPNVNSADEAQRQSGRCSTHKTATAGCGGWRDWSGPADTDWTRCM